MWRGVAGFNNFLQLHVLHFLTKPSAGNLSKYGKLFSGKEKELRKTLVVLLMVFGLITSGFAQTDNQSERRLGPLAALKNALNLTDAQVTAIQALLQTRETRAQALRTEIEQKRTALENLLNAATPNPTDVGNAAIALRASEKKLAAERDWFITELKKLLTGDQQQKLDTLLAANPRLLGGLGGPGGFGPGGPGGPGPRGGRGQRQ
jgi:Spy/CpxP family protein refolding chaperone